MGDDAGVRARIESAAGAGRHRRRVPARRRRGRRPAARPAGPESAFGEYRGDSRHFARVAIDAGADLVLGSGPHVLRGLELYKNRLIAYSLGNLAGWHNFGTGGRSSLSALITRRTRRRPGASSRPGSPPTSSTAPASPTPTGDAAPSS